MYISLNCTCQKLHFPEHALARIYISSKARLAGITLARNYIFLKDLFSTIYVWPKLHFPENLSSRIRSWPKLNFFKTYFPEIMHILAILFYRMKFHLVKFFFTQNLLTYFH